MMKPRITRINVNLHSLHQASGLWDTDDGGCYEGRNDAIEVLKEIGLSDMAARTLTAALVAHSNQKAHAEDPTVYMFLKVSIFSLRLHFSHSFHAGYT